MINPSRGIAAPLTRGLKAGACFLAIFGSIHASEIPAAEGPVYQQILLLKIVRPYVERADLGGLDVLLRASEQVLAAIEKNGLVHMATLNQYRRLVDAYRDSRGLFRRITTEKTRESIARMGALTEKIARDRGFDEQPRTEVTASIYTQMHQLLLRLTAVEGLPAPLVEKARALIPEIGRTVAVAQSGDTPKAMAMGVDLSRQIAGLYPDLNQILSSNDVFYLTIDILTLNQRFTEFAQVDGDPLPEGERGSP